MEDWTVVYTAAFPADAEMIKSLLEAGGVTVFLKDELSVQVFGLGAALGGVKLLVPAADAPRAVEILTAAGYGDPAEDSSSPAAE